MKDYIDFGIVFRIDDLDSGVFYIGETTNERNWNLGYMGTGSDKWQNHLKKYPSAETEPDNPNAHHYTRTILRDGFTSKKSLYEAELEEILKYADYVDGSLEIVDPLCKNVKTHLQGSYIPCDECGSLGIHRRCCSKYTEPSVCEECGGTYGNHKSICSHYTAPSPCPHCGSKTSHRKDCVLYKRENVKCTKTPDCVGSYHYKECPKYRVKVCSECNGKNGHHYITCSRYKVKSVCSECGGKNGSHKLQCSKYKPVAGICNECKGKNGHHKKTCGRFIPYTICSECGAERGHFKTCSRYNR